MRYEVKPSRKVAVVRSYPQKNCDPKKKDQVVADLVSLQIERFLRSRAFVYQSFLIEGFGLGVCLSMEPKSTIRIANL